LFPCFLILRAIEGPRCFLTLPSTTDLTFSLITARSIDKLFGFQRSFV
jgi:hypothetical protein